MHARAESPTPATAASVRCPARGYTTPRTRNFNTCLPKYEAVKTAHDAARKGIPTIYDRVAIGPWSAGMRSFFLTVLRHQALIPQNCLVRLQHLRPSPFVSVLAYP